MYTVALCCDTNYLVPALVTLSSVAGVVPARERAEIAVSLTASEISSAQAGTVRDAIRRLGFGGCGIRLVRPPSDSWLRHRGYITSATYLRFTLTEADVRRPYVVYLDSDLIVLGGLDDAFDLVAPGQVGLVRDEIVRSIGRDHALPGLVDVHPHLRGSPYFNAGAIWLVSDDLATFREGTVAQLRRNAHHIYFNDQDALNLWLLAGSSVARLPPEFNRFELGRFRERSDWINRAVGPAPGLSDARVVHFVGSHKPWHRSCPGTDAVTTYLGILADTRRLLRRLGDLVLDIPGQA
jgi:lipopolysaccharide biosynthesis glycosyltransferase